MKTAHAQHRVNDYILIKPFVTEARMYRSLTVTLLIQMTSV